MRSDFSQYTPDYISGVMSLRDPQEESVKILKNIVEAVNLHKGMNLDAALGAVHAMYPTCTSFERGFLSVTFAIATAVGKTRLMGAFIAYLYTQRDIHNFFVVAPNTTIYDKLKSDFTDQSSEKYVFKGLGCFSMPPQVIKDDDYKDRDMSLFESDVHIFMFNIDKFNKENANMRDFDELLGESFYGFLSNLPDLVMIMDESHHYRAEKGMDALNELHPLLGLELTATPIVTKGSKQEKFKNVVYEFPLSEAIAKGYTRTPYAVTRTDIDFKNFGTEEMDKLMINDGIACHENAKRKLKQYAINNSTPENPIQVIKPFMLIVCKDVDHANWVKDYVCSDEFKGGAYKNKTIIVHSKQKGAESDENIRLLLDVERPDNPVEIVIHVNMLKEGWDVNNLYTIVPLRTAASKVLREQMVGRGLRLPYGKRTGDTDVDAVMLTAHDKFADILAEAQKGDSIFKAGNIIDAGEIEDEKLASTQVSVGIDEESDLNNAYEYTGIERSEENDEAINAVSSLISEEVAKYAQNNPGEELSAEQTEDIAKTVEKKMSEDQKEGKHSARLSGPLKDWATEKAAKAFKTIQGKYIPIPQIKVIDSGEEEYKFVDFDIDLTDFTHVPIADELLIQNLEDLRKQQIVRGEEIDFEGYNPKKEILDELRDKPEIDYEKCSDLLFKLITQVCDFYQNEFGEHGMKNIVMLNKKDIVNKIYEQMMNHFYCGSDTVIEEVDYVRGFDLTQSYTYKEAVDLFDSYTENIHSVLFTGIEKGVFDIAKFDSDPELRLARILEADMNVLNWLRPAPKDFNITYNRGKNYEPDFVAETDDAFYLIEVKAENKMDDPDVVAKRERSVEYCELVTVWNREYGGKPWIHLFIPSLQITPSTTFKQIAIKFPVTE